MKNPKSLQATIHIPLGTTGNLDEWASRMMQGMANECMVSLTKAPDEHALRNREWKPLYNAEGGWMGKIVVQCNDEEELLRMHGHLQGKKVGIGGHMAAIRVQSDFLNLPL